MYTLFLTNRENVCKVWAQTFRGGGGFGEGKQNNDKQRTQKKKKRRQLTPYSNSNLEGEGSGDGIMKIHLPIHSRWCSEKEWGV